MPKLKYVLRGVKWSSCQLPPHLLRQIKQVWDKSGNSCDIKMLWGVAVCVIFVVVRARKMSVPNDKACDPAIHFSINDVPYALEITPLSIMS